MRIRINVIASFERFDAVYVQTTFASQFGRAHRVSTRRYYVRSGIERVFSHLHEAHGGKFVRVRGSAKVLLHLMFGPITMASGH